jgi:hypothetical protein
MVSYNCRRTLIGHEATITDLCFKDDQLFSSSLDKSIRGNIQLSSLELFEWAVYRGTAWS